MTPVLPIHSPSLGNGISAREQLVHLLVLWSARLGGLAAIVPLLLILVGEPGTGPAGPRGWAYLLLFPIGFSAGYLLGWRWPLVGGSISLVCMMASAFVLGRVFPAGAYLIWFMLCVPGLLFLIAGALGAKASVRHNSIADQPGTEARKSNDNIAVSPGNSWRAISLLGTSRIVR